MGPILSRKINIATIAKTLIAAGLPVTERAKRTFPLSDAIVDHRNRHTLAGSGPLQTGAWAVPGQAGGNFSAVTQANP